MKRAPRAGSSGDRTAERNSTCFDGVVARSGAHTDGVGANAVRARPSGAVLSTCRASGRTSFCGRPWRKSSSRRCRRATCAPARTSAFQMAPTSAGSRADHHADRFGGCRTRKCVHLARVALLLIKIFSLLIVKPCLPPPATASPRNRRRCGPAMSECSARCACHILLIARCC